MNTTDTGWRERLKKIVSGRAQSRYHRNYIATHIVEELVQGIAKEEYERGRKTKSEDLNHALYALGLMWNQYCGEKGHLFMSAGEHASDVLEHHGLLRGDDEEADWDKLDALLEAALETQP